MASTYYNTEGLVLKKMPFGEADFLVRLLTKDFGKMDALAKGARKAGAKLNAHLEMLNVIKISFVKNGERIPTLIDVDGVAKLDDWLLDMDRMELVGKMLKTIDLIVPAGSPDLDVYALVCDVFRSAPTANFSFLVISR